MTVFYLVRHGDNDSVGHGISGRLDGIHLNERGRAQAREIAERLAGTGIARVFSSPLERARETAAPLGARLGLTVEVLEDVTEVDFGNWTGKPFTQLDPDAHWRRFNRVRSVTRIPHGELMIEVQARMVGAIDRLRHACPEARVAIVGHGDPLRLALAYYAGIPLDLMQNIHVDIASVSTLAVDDHGARVLCLNHKGDRPTG